MNRVLVRHLVEDVRAHVGQAGDDLRSRHEEPGHETVQAVVGDGGGGKLFAHELVPADNEGPDLLDVALYLLREVLGKDVQRPGEDEGVVIEGLPQGDGDEVAAEVAGEVPPAQRILR